MPKDAEFTPSSKVEVNKLKSWEEPLPLKDIDIEQLKIEKQQVLVTKPIPPPESASKNRFKLNRKAILIVATLIIFATLVGFAANFATRKKDKIETQKTNLQIPSIPKTTFRRLSSAFVPKNPSSEPAKLWVNWEKFQDRESGLAFFYPAEWQVVKNLGASVYTIYYPSQDINENFGAGVLAKFSIVLQNPPSNLVEFLVKRYNLTDASFTRVVNEDGSLQFEFSKTFVLAKPVSHRLFILEGEVANQNDFENFLPIFLNIAQSFQILQ